MNIVEVFHIQTHIHPDATALIDTWRGRSHLLSFSELELASARAAALLWQEGLRPGDTVLVFHPMSSELYIALVALFRLKLVAMFLDPFAGRDQIERCCRLSSPKALLASSKAHILRLISPALRRIPLKFAIGLPVPGAISWTKGADLNPYKEIVPCDPDTSALMTFTSGSTGQPKAAVRTHGFLLAQHNVLEESLRLTDDDVVLTTLPIFVLSHIGSGVTSLIPDADLRYPGAIQPAPVIAQIQAHQVTTIEASPAFLECLVRYCAEHNLTLPYLKRVFTGGAPVFPRLLDQLRDITPNAEIISLYGSTEAEPIAHIAYSQTQPEDIKAMLCGYGLVAGQPVEAIQIRILSDQWGTPIGPYTEAEFRERFLPPGEAGEIVVSGPHVLSGYLHGDGNQETKFTVGGSIWHRTGDAGYRDAQGRVWLLGRCMARIRDEHGTLYPFAVECAVSHHPGVCRAAFVFHRGRRILAIELYDRRYHTVIAQLKEALAWAHIDEIQVYRHIPVDKRHNAKIDYRALYKLLEER
ncbi:MAG: AMP-binding protein [Candidatus Tectomicrobia bacterium]|nr:AMP-binding protein [Candidatus Tectomicrobia bacterium]